MIPHITEPLIDELPVKENERISAVAAHDRNIYIGTSKGNLFHYHLFEDAIQYLQITSLSVGNKEVTQLVTSSALQKLFLVIDGTLLVFSLPELSPFSARQLKNIRHICLMEDGVSIMLIKPSGIQLIQLSDKSWKLLREFKHEGIISGTAPLNNLILLANGESYEVLDMSSGETIPLFDYKSDTDVPPFIVLFSTPDSKEYLLTVASDENTSIAQFVDTSGDVTRGTLTWLNHGYPRGGVTIDWPYAFAMFKSSIVVSSLQSLDTVLVMDIDNASLPQTSENNGNAGKHSCDFRIQKINVFFQDKSTEEVTGQPIESSSSMVVFSEKTLYVIHQDNEITVANRAFHEAMESNDFKHFFAVAHGDSPYVHILRTMAAFLTEQEPVELLTERKDGRLIIEPNLALRLLGYEYPFFMYPGLNEILDMWDFKDDDMAKRYLQKLKLNDMSSEIRLLSYKFVPENDLDSLIAADKWTFSGNDKSVIEILIERSQTAKASRIYQMIPESPELVSAYKDFLFQHLQVSLVDDALTFLAKEHLEEKDYSKLILEIIKLNKDKGYAFMRKSTMYREINQKILNELSDDSKGEKDYALLRIELLESSFAENGALRGELLGLIFTTLTALYDDDIKEIFKKLHDEYKEMNNLSKYKWPKISWVNFLAFAKEQKNQTFIELYLKSFELVGSDDKRLEGALFAYHKLYTKQDIQGLLDFGDYSTAERLALGERAAQRKRYYKWETVNQTGVNNESLLVIFKYYLGLYERDQPVEPAIQHFVESYAKNISPTVIIKLLPDQFPLANLTNFLKESLVGLQFKSREEVMTKSIIKSEIARTKHLIKDFL
ncbi:hypothetical protein CANMA_003532 [Candida margitis]|uniref:uncharacterized protein n=1 Tax=Candida margitis TaxID=1775924 RepID=UPI00222791B8|nr:uncharacterized protein CANMA_003532 [Candida margitis]KAI5963935.1 hypothetical protein CANMA_003532 [Candida margitis]